MDCTVIVPVRNGADLIERQLQALVAQECRGTYEVLVINNGSTDGTLRVVHRMADRYPLIRVIDAPRIASRAEAVNVGVQHTDSIILVTADHDDLVERYWLAAMIERLGTHDLVSGVTSLCLEPISQYDFDEASFYPDLRIHGGFLSFALGCNMGFTRRLFDTIRGFDPAFAGAEDIDFSWRAQLSGFSIGLAREARVIKSVRSTFSERYHQHFAYGKADAALSRRFRKSGYRGVVWRAAKQLAWVALNAPSALAKRGPALSDAGAVAGSALGVIVGSVRMILSSIGNRFRCQRDLEQAHWTSND
jgi:glycosyltransferase involved in cell wall biosynthesis